jgi:hypothetical protein
MGTAIIEINDLRRAFSNPSVSTAEEFLILTGIRSIVKNIMRRPSLICIQQFAQMRLIAIVILISFCGTAIACSCHDENKQSAHNLVFSSFTFEGTIISVNIVQADSSESLIKALFKVSKWLSPRSGADTISIFTSQTSCGLGFPIGTSWMLFANYFNGRLASNYCDGSFLKGDDPDTKQILQYFNNLVIGVHDLNIELNSWNGNYHLAGRLEHGEPVGTWTKIRQGDTLDIYNFQDGSLIGWQMVTDEETTPPERHFYHLARTGEHSMVMTTYDKDKKPDSECTLKDGPLRFRYQGFYLDYLPYVITSNFKQVGCRGL